MNLHPSLETVSSQLSEPNIKVSYTLRIQGKRKGGYASVIE